MNERIRALLLRDACVAAGINVAIGTTITWLVFGRVHDVPVWGGHGLVFDAIPSTFLPVLGLCFGVSSAIRQRRKTGRLAGVDSDLNTPTWLRWMPRRVALRALCLATLTTAIVLPLTALAFRVFAIESLVLPAVFALKLAQLAMLGLLLGPIVAYRALLDH